MAIYVTKIEKPDDRFHQGYKYIITLDSISYEAYKTEKGFKFFVKSRNLKLIKTSDQETKQYGRVETFTDEITTIDDRYFWELSDIPNNAVKFTGLSNGSLVDCYYLNEGNKTTIYRPNPNAKEVYKPLDLNAHIAYMRENG